MVNRQPVLGDAIARLRPRGDGVYELSVQLHPAELGAVNVSARISNGQLTVTVACADAEARAAVTAALPALQHQLASAGFGGVDLGFGSTGRPAGPVPGQPANQQPAPPQGQPSGQQQGSLPGHHPDPQHSQQQDLPHRPPQPASQVGRLRDRDAGPTAPDPLPSTSRSALRRALDRLL